MSTLRWRNLKTQLLRFGLPYTLIRHENGAFRNCFTNRRNLKTSGLRFRVDRKHHEYGAFRKRLRHDYHVISLSEFSSTTNSKWPMIVALLNSFGELWMEYILCVFRLKLPFSNFSGVVKTGLKLALPKQRF